MKSHIWSRNQESHWSWKAKIGAEAKKTIEIEQAGI